MCSASSFGLPSSAPVTLYDDVTPFHVLDALRAKYMFDRVEVILGCRRLPGDYESLVLEIGVFPDFDFFAGGGMAPGGEAPGLRLSYMERFEKDSPEASGKGLEEASRPRLASSLRHLLGSVVSGKT